MTLVGLEAFTVNGQELQATLDQDEERQFKNEEERISPVPLSSILKTSMTEDFSGFRILHVPSPETVDFSPERR